MDNLDTTTLAVTLTDVLMLEEKLRTLGWSFNYCYGAKNEGITYVLFNHDTSPRRRRNDICLVFRNIELAKALAVLIESGRKETVISGELNNAPFHDTYVEMVMRLSEHGCRLRGEMNFDRMAIAYNIKINDQMLMFNEWEAVEEFAQLLDRGAPNKARVRVETVQADDKEGMAV